MSKAKVKREIVCFTDNKVQCFNDVKVARLRASILDRESLDPLAQHFKVLGHPVRLQILELLGRENCCVCDLANVLQQPVSTLSQHLKSLKTVGAVRSRQVGKFIVYSLDRERLEESLGTLKGLLESKESVSS